MTKPTHTLSADADASPSALETKVSAQLLADLKAVAMSPAAYDNAVRQIQTGAATVVVDIPTHLVAWSRFANRNRDAFKTEEFFELKDAIARSGGNTVPIAVRALTFAPQPMAGSDEPAYEIVFGHRRHQACRELGLPVRAILLKQISDRDLAHAMYNENEARSSLTPFEAGTMYETWRQQGLYKGVNEISRAIGRSPADVSRALRIVNLPEAIISAFESPLQLQYRDADEIGRLLALNEDAVLEAAKSISELGGKVSRSEVLKRLALAADKEGVGSSNTCRKVPLAAGDRKLGIATWDTDGAGVIRLVPGLTPDAQQKVEEALAKLVARELAAAKRSADTAKAAATK